MRDGRCRRGLGVAAALAAAGAAMVLIGAPQAGRAQGTCPGDLDGQTMAVSGSVVEVGDDGFSQYMVILDDATGCRVVIYVADDAAPCPYGGRASITVPVSRSESGDVDYFDDGTSESYYDCS